MHSKCFVFFPQVFLKFCVFGDKANPGTMDGRTWKKVVTDCGLIGKGYSSADIDLTFARVKDKAAKKITFNEFLKAIAEVATKSGVSTDVIINKIVSSGGPKSSGTVAAANKFHDDKSLYSGVHGKGGPSTNDNRISLNNLADRSAADARGVKK